MSEAHYKIGGLRFWTEREILLRDQAIHRLHETVSRSLREINRAWHLERLEGPILTPRQYISDAYDESDVWLLSARLGEDKAVLRPETTPSSYVYANHLLKSGKARMPLCVWQAGKSFRRETNDGASASKLRFYEFWQLEFQCIYRTDTKADYTQIIPAIAAEIGAITNKTASIVDSDRLPAYSTSTTDVEVPYRGRATEMASLSLRTDFAEDAIVFELAIGLDRLISASEAA